MIKRALFLLMLVCACGGPDYGEAFIAPYRAAQRAKNAGRYQEAADLYLDAANGAKRVKDRDEALFNRALMFERMENWDEARGVYRKIIEVSPRGPRTARSAFEHATNHIDHGNAEVGFTELVRAVERYPAHGAAPYAIKRWVMHHSESKGEAAVQRQLTAWLAKLGKTALAQQLKYEMGKSYHRAGNLQKAHVWLVRAAREHPLPKGNLTDDAWWRAAEVASKMGKHQLAIDNLEELLQAREYSEWTFSYERPRFPQAQMRIAEIYRDDLKNTDEARAAYKLVFSRHKTSILADDAMWQAALLARAAGDTDDMCDLAEDLPDRFPDSRYNKCVHVLCAEAPKGKRPCPPYILEQLE